MYTDGFKTNKSTGTKEIYRTIFQAEIDTIKRCVKIDLEEKTQLEKQDTSGHKSIEFLCLQLKMACQCQKS